MNIFIKTIISDESEIRNKSFRYLCDGLNTSELIAGFIELDQFRKSSNNLYHKVRASIFLYDGYRFRLMESADIKQTGHISPEGYNDLLTRNFEKAISVFQEEAERNGYNANLISALAECYHQLSFQLLADQVRKSVRSSVGNQWMFRVGHFDEHPLKIHPKMLQRAECELLYPLLQEKTAVRMDLTHSCWSDIFFLGMDYPEGARVVNVSVDLGIYGRDNEIRPPLESYVRVINEPVLRLTSLDLNVSKDVASLMDLFNFGNDYLSLLKAAVIAAGVIPPSFESTNYQLSDILSKLISPGMGLELVTKVNDIPKGSRLAVSTNLLASMIGALMRATQQTTQLEGALSEMERRLIASRAILGEWLGGSGGGWQDSGGIWPGVKAIEGVVANEKDPEYNVSRGCLLPKHRLLLSGDGIHPEFEQRINKSLILIHGGMASNVGPILEMVTEKYLLRGNNEWEARLKANEIFDKVLVALKDGDIKRLASLTSQNFEGPIKTIIPWASNHFTETVIRKTKELLKDNYWGFLMLGGMSGGGMGLFVNPEIYEKAKDIVLKMLVETKKEMEQYLPFAMNPVVYNFNINQSGSVANLFEGNKAIMPVNYYKLLIPMLVNMQADQISEIRKAELEIFTSTQAIGDNAYFMLRSIISSLFRFSTNTDTFELDKQNKELEKIKQENGFDYIQHEQIRQDIIKGRIGLSRNRLPEETNIEDVDNDLMRSELLIDKQEVGEKAIKNGNIAVLCLAAGVGSRWTKGAGVIKAVNPFVDLLGLHRSFIEIHLAKNKKTIFKHSGDIPFVVATSYLTNESIEKQLRKSLNFQYPSKVYLSQGKSIGQRFIPMERDLRFLWEEMPQEQLDENKQKVRESIRESLIQWAKSKGEGSDYVDNISHQRLNPLGHWYEVANLLRNGTLRKLLDENKNVEHIMLHNIDTLGANVSAEIAGYHIESGNALTFEVIPRRIEDRGGGLAVINGKMRMLEGLAQPHESDELSLSYYSTMTTWINIDKLLVLFGLNRSTFAQLSDDDLTNAVRKIARRMPSYVTIKDVKYRWGHGQEDIYPVEQIEKLWGDMSALPDLQCGYVVVPRHRGQQLKDPAQLDSWVADGSKDFIASLCKFE